MDCQRQIDCRSFHRSAFPAAVYRTVPTTNNALCALRSALCATHGRPRHSANCHGCRRHVASGEGCKTRMRERLDSITVHCWSKAEDDLDKATPWTNFELVSSSAPSASPTAPCVGKSQHHSPACFSNHVTVSRQAYSREEAGFQAGQGARCIYFAAAIGGCWLACTWPATSAASGPADVELLTVGALGGVLVIPQSSDVLWFLLKHPVSSGLPITLWQHLQFKMPAWTCPAKGVSSLLP
jgi:hypothetical protein